jgi:hypothetical protein
MLHMAGPRAGLFVPPPLTLFVGNTAGGPDVAISQGAFALTVPPGRYQVRHVQVADPASAAPIDIPMGVGTFVVPPTGCIDLGTVTVGVVRLGSGTQAEQADQARSFAQQNGSRSEFVYLPSGGYLLDSYVENTAPPQSDPAAAGCTPTKIQ